MITLKTEQWTPQQAWAVYQVVEQLHDYLLEQHHESFRYFRWREEKMEEYCRIMGQFDEEGKDITLQEWMGKSPKPDDPVPF